MSILRILLAEDDDDDREMFCTFLAGRNDVELFACVENGLEAIDALAAIISSDKLPDMILLDQNMPKQNGLQTLKILKENPVYAAIPVFIYSTYADGALRERSLQAGAISVFSKPFTMQGYNEMLESMLSAMHRSSFDKNIL
ncbi:response regulator [Chitinophaga pinensis]|uniref:Response regulator receiver protein n=1 Tax=Chitinophaga pinensis (strain ATCC 43595 / DSM 2588 / LMG 13176 / NBRC 15968 / NCIMB 11800 / UQM 2034) TaxID=485918 RepID=A0A979G6J3_CHIPD|nr:response regulator [Chitinophaga pinensis]ACU61785.1 response regulator receiver protein [Chitinophaga pinensis DSM 2588]